MRTRNRTLRPVVARPASANRVFSSATVRDERADIGWEAEWVERGAPPHLEALLSYVHCSAHICNYNHSSQPISPLSLASLTRAR